MTHRGRAVASCATVVAAVATLTLHGQSRSRVAAGGPPGGELNDIVVSPGRPAVLYASPMWGGVFKSADGGRSWVEADAGLPDTFCDLRAHPTDARVVFARCATQLYRTSDAGRRWVRLAASALPDPFVPRVLISGSDPAVPGTAYLTAGARLLRRDADGAPWSIVRDFHDDVEQLIVGGAASPRSLLVRTNDDLFRSDDDGAHWTAIGAGLKDTVVSSIGVDPASTTTIYAATFKGLMVTVDGGAHWSVRPGDGLGRTVDASIAIDAGAIRVSSEGGDFVSTDAGNTWHHTERAAATRRAPATDGVTWQAPSSPAIRYRIAADAIFTTADGGTHWTATGRPADPMPMALAISPFDPALAYVSAGEILKPKSLWRSRDGARTWERADRCSELSLTRACAAIFDPNDADTIYERTVGESPEAGWETVRRSVDGGDTWQPLATPAAVWLLTVLPTTPTTLFVDVPGGAGGARHTLWKSTDRGDHWRRSDTGLPRCCEVRVLVMDPARPARLFAHARGRGVFISEDGGGTWHPTRPRLAAADRE
jgi:photosystem II stability/assembly factor-like uncharacterized protein